MEFMKFLSIKEKHATTPIDLGLDVCVVCIPAAPISYKKGNNCSTKIAIKTQTHVAVPNISR